MFVGREKELALLKETILLDNKATLIYGKRRVGKTSLIKKAVSECGCRVIYYECTRTTLRENVRLFGKILIAQGLPSFIASFETFQDVFDYLSTLQEHLVIVIDEYPYLSTFEESQSVDSVFQNIIDSRLQNAHLILSGSQISVMKSMLEEGNALYGRFSKVIPLRELNYRQASAFYPSKSFYEKVGFYSVFGGSPFVLQELDEKESLEQNITRTILSETNPVHLYAANILLTDYRNAINIERILAVLGNGKKKYSEIEKALQLNKSGNLAKQLKALTSMELVHQVTPINRKNDNQKRFYEINDNLMRFYYTYLYPNQSALQMISEKAFLDQLILPDLYTSFIPRRFEDICRSFFSLSAREGKLPGITNIGMYYYDDPVQHKNGEFDVALEFKNEYEIYESKCLTKPLPLSMLHREANQIREIPGLNIRKIGFVSVNGFEEKEEGYSCYEGKDLYR